MACSKYISTKETTHAARVSRLLVDPCSDLFRDILRNHVTEIQFPGILQKEKSTLNPILNKVQRETLYPRSGNFNGTYAEFDLSLLYILLRNISGIAPHQRGWAKSPDPSDRSLSANIDRIREIRNTYCGHAVTVSLSGAEFQKLWQDLTVIVSELEGSLPGGCTTYKDAAKMIKTVTMDPEQEKVFLDMIDEQQQCTEDLKVKLLTQGTALMELKAEQYRQGSELQILVDERHRQDKRHDSESRNILENTLAVLKVHTLKKVNIRISSVQTTVEKLRDSHIAILTGKGGTGKTNTAYDVMCEMSDPSLESPFTPVLIKSPEQWDKVINPINQFIVYLDDFIGSTNLDTSTFDKWKKQVDVIFSCAKTGNVLVLMGLRRNILDEVKSSFVHAILDDKNIVDLSSPENLTMKDKAKILDAYEDNCNFKASELSGDTFFRYSKKKGFNAVYRLSDREKEEILSVNPYYGFPLTCFQFFSRCDFFQLGPSYFQHPDAKLFETIENMRRAKCGNIIEKVKFCVLCYVFINGSIETSRMSQTLLKSICEKLRIYDIPEIDIKDAINDLNGLFLSKITTNNLYEFSHETILETVLVSFGQLAPDIVIERCSRKKLHELIRTETYQVKPGEVVLKIPRRHYENLAKRLLCVDDIDSEEFMKNVLAAVDIRRHQGCKDPEFVSVLLNCEMSDNLSFWFLHLFKNCFTLSTPLLYKDQDVLLRGLLERYGPHHTTVLQSSVAKLIINYIGKMLRYGPHLATPVQQLSHPKSEISLKCIEEILQKHFVLNDKSKLSIIVSYIYKYSDMPDLRNLFHTTTGNRLTVLHHCVIHGWGDLVDIILEVHTPTKTSDNWSCAHLAAYAGRSMLLQKFMNLGHDITEKTSDGYSVLQTALLGLRYGHHEVCNPSNTVHFSCTFREIKLSFPESNEFENIFNALLTKNTKCEIVDLMMAVDEYGNAIVHYLVMLNYRDTLDCLLQYDKKFVFQRNVSDLPTALHVAVYLGRPEMVRKLWTIGIRPLNSDLSLMETCHQGERFCNRVIHYISIGGIDSKGLSSSMDDKVCRNERNNDAMKFKTKEKVKVVFGSIEDFQNTHDFLLDRVKLLQ